MISGSAALLLGGCAAVQPIHDPPIEADPNSRNDTSVSRTSVQAAQPFQL